jgi:hypothetical protein
LFDNALGRIDDDIVRAFDGLDVTREGVDWRKAGLIGPSSTWTYLVTDTPVTSDPLASLAARPSIGLPLTAVYAPFFMAWGAFSLWRSRRRQRKDRERRQGSSPPE